MEAKISVTLRPFPVPVGVMVEPLPSKLAAPPVPGSAPPPPPAMLLVPLEQFSFDEIVWLCDEFQRAVFRKAGLPAYGVLRAGIPARAPKLPKEMVARAVADLRALLTGQEGNICVSGTGEDINKLRNALETLEIYLDD